MGEIINLRTMKKRLARAAGTAGAKESRVRHGRTKTAKANDARDAARQVTRLDALRRETKPA
jgi:hypothetical protein